MIRAIGKYNVINHTLKVKLSKIVNLINESFVVLKIYLRQLFLSFAHQKSNHIVKRKNEHIEG